MTVTDTSDTEADTPASGGTRDLRLESLTKEFATFTAVDDIDLVVAQGSFFALLGPSGCGKTTTLRMVAGLERPTAGRILLGDLDVTTLKPYQRPVNTVFQSYALFPHLTVFENVAFGMRRQGKKDVDAEVDKMCELVELGGQTAKKPAQMSGGQQQRVALARALINKPEVLLLDEPTAGLTEPERRKIGEVLRQLVAHQNAALLLIEHDLDFVRQVGDRVVVLDHGRVAYEGGIDEAAASPLVQELYVGVEA